MKAKFFCYLLFVICLFIVVDPIGLALYHLGAGRPEPNFILVHGRTKNKVPSLTWWTTSDLVDLPRVELGIHPCEGCGIPFTYRPLR